MKNTPSLINTMCNISDDDYLFMKKFIADAVYDDYDRLVQLCDALAMPTGFCLLEKRFVGNEKYISVLLFPIHVPYNSGIHLSNVFLNSLQHNTFDNSGAWLPEINMSGENK